MSERTTIRLPEGLLSRAKRKAAAEGRTLTSLIEEGLWLVTAEQRKSGQGKRVDPPVSTATGGPMPGVDLTDFSALQDNDDREYVTRMQHFK
jgi:hypothetical protein